VIDEITRRIECYVCVEDEGEGRRAAVLLPLYHRDGELHVVLTKRTDKVEKHKGEISFPGGVVDPTDVDKVFTALRESSEEIGLLPAHVRIVGRLDDQVTRTGFHITAIVGLIEPELTPYPWLPQPSEVAQVLEVPVSHLADPANAIEVPRQLSDGSLVLVPAFIYGEHTIWGATAKVLRNFLDVAYAAEDAAMERAR
jgi:8-oxo-dGTP pyrophosphatase MutT (NUDIX family)